MNANLFDDTLAAGLLDQAGTLWDPDTRAKAAMRAALAYSSYRPHMRRYSTGNLFLPVSASATSINVIGGTWAPGDTLNFFGLNAESATVQSVAQVNALDNLTPLLAITLQAGTAYAHAEGTLVQRAPASGQPVAGLNIVSGVDTYMLPLDWLGPEQESFDLAVGDKAQVRRESSFYDAVYGQSNQLSGTGYGGSSNFSGGYLAGQGAGVFFPMAGGSVISPSGGTGQTIYRFLRNEPPILVVTPAPQANAVLDFYYYGAHTIQSIPGGDFEPVLCYALYVALMSMAAAMAGRVDYATGTADKVYPSKSAEQLRANAQINLTQWEQRLVKVPIALSG